MADQRAHYKAARRAVAREHHPDFGGDPEVYIRALAEIDRIHLAEAVRFNGSVSGYPTTRGQRWRRWLRQARTARRLRRRQWFEL
ncbi:hypothetical protein [Hoyosella subflava]|uniref:J domain-containing protein n=1 Tax=Hoyosella subflava (strain DSM 45089 / JCM 17490 / NBRC 109087 / DQS3-9A1) TaxID=443218 RepID=F6EMV4_HOYSD|nr:hypothetical protein [Hoyosella subflava]AEF42846.1 hypothetical protein AS9A_4413 [Hoyosella subflava DQS3-9A1]